MKKRLLKLKRALSVLLSAVMIGSAAFAAAPAMAETAPAPSEESAPITITPTYYNTYSQWVNDKSQITDVIFAPDEDTKVIPLTIASRELLAIGAEVVGDTQFSSIVVTLYEDAACTKKFDYSLYLYNDSAADYGFFTPQKAQTAYLKIELTRSSYDPYATLNMAIYSYALSAKNRTLKANTYYVAGYDYALGDQYYKIAVTKPGLVTFNFTTYNDFSDRVTVTLLNSKKKEISDSYYGYVKTDLDKNGNYSGVKTYALKKGYYYLKVDSASTSMFAFKYSFKAVTDQSGKTKAKATKLTVGGKAKKGLLTQTDKTDTYDWYKLTLTKPTAFTISISTKTDSTVYLEVTNANGRAVIGGYANIYDGKNTLSTDGKFSKGTYYIKLYKTKARSSAYYSIAIKKQ